MTKEQAIKFANCLKNNYTIDFNDMADFCDTVIKALEQEPSEDCVSREQAIVQLSIDLSEIELPRIKDSLDKLPPVTSTRKVGKWVKYNTSEKYDYLGDRVTVSNYQCSECGRMIYDIGNSPLTNKLKDYPFCHCGAEMVGVEG